MAKRKPKAKATAAKMIGVNDFKNLVKQCANLKKKAGTSTSEMGGLISNAAEHKHLDKSAFSIFRRLDAMDPQKLGTTLACFDYYRDIGGLDDKVAEEPVLEMARPEAGEGGGDKVGTFRTLSLVPNKLMPSKKRVKEIADKAEKKANGELQAAE